tara:strand:- start:960 stop:1655 length:696 start_codon:yes stop_codon:yes gene_type:complete
MKKLLISGLLLIGSFSMASAEVGAKLGVSLNVGIFEASGFETDIGPNATEKNLTTGTNEMLGVMGSVFIEKSLGFLPGPLGRLSIGVDHVPHDIKTGSQGRNDDKLTGLAEGGGATREAQNSASATLNNINTYYLTLNITDWLYLKGGMMEMDVISTETLESGNTYNNGSIDGTVIGLGVQSMSENGLFFRAEFNQTDLDGTTLKSTNTNNSVTISEVKGDSYKLSIGKSF